MLLYCLHLVSFTHRFVKGLTLLDKVNTIVLILLTIIGSMIPIHTSLLMYRPMLTLLHMQDFRQAVLSANRAHDRPILSEETLNAILSNVGSLCILNSGLLSELEDRLKKW